VWRKNDDLVARYSEYSRYKIACQIEVFLLLEASNQFSVVIHTTVK
jgi:hypothetical protein